jgi:hypothetical protein
MIKIKDILKEVAFGLLLIALFTALWFGIPFITIGKVILI